MHALKNRALHEESATSAIRSCCQHGEAVVQALAQERCTVENPTAVFEGDEIELVLREATKAPGSLLTAKCCKGILELNASAKREGVPLLIRLGDTGWFAIRQSIESGRTIVGGWAHIKSDGIEGMEPCRKRRTRQMPSLMCKASNRIVADIAFREWK